MVASYKGKNSQEVAAMIQEGWPGAQFRLDAVTDTHYLKHIASIVPGLYEQVMEEAAERILEATQEHHNGAMQRVGDHILTWWDNLNLGKTRPDAAALEAGKDTFEAGATAKRDAALAAKAFKQEWPHERIIAALKDKDQQQALIEAAQAVE